MILSCYRCHYSPTITGLLRQIHITIFEVFKEFFYFLFWGCNIFIYLFVCLFYEFDHGMYWAEHLTVLVDSFCVMVTMTHICYFWTAVFCYSLACIYANTDIVLDYCPTEHHRLVIMDLINNSNITFVIVFLLNMKDINFRKISFIIFFLNSRSKWVAVPLYTEENTREASLMKL